MAMAGHFVQLQQPGSFSTWTFGSPGLRIRGLSHCDGRLRMVRGCGRTSQLSGGRLRNRFGDFGGVLDSRRGRICLGLGGAVVAAAGDVEAREVEVMDDDEISSFPDEFKELTIDRGDPPNYLLFAAGFGMVVLMRDAILQELARWGIGFGRIALFTAEAITIGLGKLSNVAAEPISVLLAVVSWALMAVSDVYTIIVEAAPVGTLVNSLVLSLAVLSIGDATASKVKGSRSRLVGIAMVIGLAGILEIMSPEVVLLSLVAVTSFAQFIQKADPVTVFMPATVTFVAISEPIIQAVAFALFLALSIHTSWRATGSQSDSASSEQTPSEAHGSKAYLGRRPSFVLVAITAAICISLAARFLYHRSVKWLLLR